MHVGPELGKWTIVQQWVNAKWNEVPTVDADRAYFTRKAANGRNVRSEMTTVGEYVCAFSPLLA
jgi:hypothetical protein